MGRRPNFKTSQWLRLYESNPWSINAECRRHQSLPWTSDQRPNATTHLIMGAICDACPVRRDCAGYALHGDVTGGFYAGLWLPWKSRHMSRDDKQESQIVRRRLRLIVKGITSA